MEPFPAVGSDRSADCFAGSTRSVWFTSHSFHQCGEALEYSSNTIWVQIALKMMGQPLTKYDLAELDQVDPAMKKLRSTFAEYGLGTSAWELTFNESTGFIEEYTVGNYLTNAFVADNYTLCNWLSMQQPMIERVILMSRSKESMTIMIRWPRSVNRSKPGAQSGSISQRRTWLWSSKEFYQVANGWNWVDDRKNRWSLRAKWPYISAKTGHSWNHCRWGQTSRLTMWGVCTIE